MPWGGGFAGGPAIFRSLTTHTLPYTHSEETEGELRRDSEGNLPGYSELKTQATLGTWGDTLEDDETAARRLRE